MTNPIGTPEERELIKLLKRESRSVFPERLRDGHAFHPTAFALDKAATALQSRIEEVAMLREAVKEARPYLEGQRLIEDGRAMMGEIDQMPLRSICRQIDAALATPTQPGDQ